MQSFEGRARIRTILSLSYADPDPLVGAVRRKWVVRLRRALAALEQIPLMVTRRFSNLHLHRVTSTSATAPSVAEPVTFRFGGIHDRKC